MLGIVVVMRDLTDGLTILFERSKYEEDYELCVALLCCIR